jgi:N-acetylglucosaminyl-diphospho-decaprenol L-rhamnosyltransferase
MTGQLTAIVVNWNAGDGLAESVASIQNSTIDATVVVVDNESSDGSIENLGATYPSVRVVQTGENLGYGRGANAGIETVESDYVVVMNPDVFLDREALAKMVAYLESHPAVGVVGPCLKDAAGHPLATCGLRPRLSDAICRKLLLHLVLPFFRFRRVRPVESTEVDWVTGACMVGRREAFAAVDGFDKAIFMYFEDVDLCLRLKTAGWSVHYVVEAIGRHIGGHSSAQAFDHMLIASDRSYRYFTAKHFGLLSARVLSLMTPLELFLRSLGWVLASVLPSKRPAARSRFRAYWKLLFENLSQSPDRFRGSVS